MVAFIYLFILLFIVIFSLYLINLTLKRCPTKIQGFYLVVLSGEVIRDVSLLALWLVNSQKIIYFIKVLPTLNIVVIPLLSLVSLYIFLRDQQRNFDYNYIFMIILILIYCTISIFYKIGIRIDSVFGFVVEYKNNLFPNLFYLIVLSSILVFTLLVTDKPYSNSVGLKVLLSSLIVTVAEFIVYLGGIGIFPYPFFGEICILGCSYKAIKTFKIK